VSDNTPAARRNKNWLLVKFREWHSWGGLFLSAFILLVAVTGILLNHKDLLLRGGQKNEPAGLLTAATDLAALPVSFARALELGRQCYGEVPLEKIELKDEGGWLVYKVCRGRGEEIRIDAHTGEVFSKYGGRPGPGGARGLNWAKLVDDLHTGKAFGGFGTLLVDLTSGVIIALTLSGLYLWGVPWLRKRRSARERQAAAGRPAAREELPAALS
jgi:uncharacterized iron-regulated membrane protein